MSEDRTFNFKAGDGNEEAAKCLKEIKSFFVLINKLKDGIYNQDEQGELPIPKSYNEAYRKVIKILDEVSWFLSDTSTNQPHVAAPMISPHLAPILRYEGEQLKGIRNMIRTELGLPSVEEEKEEEQNAPTSSGGWGKKIWNWIGKGFNSADIIISTLQAFVPVLGSVGEIKKQIQNLLPSGQPSGQP